MGERRPVINHTSEVEVTDGSVLLTFHSSSAAPDFAWIDKATAARLIRQLRKALDDDYNRSINDRPGGSDDYA